MTIRACLMAGVAGLVLGCGGGSIRPPATVLVTGQVMLKGKPAPGCLVKFHPAFNIGEIKYLPYAETGPDGNFTLNTGGDKNGAPPGDYVVTIEKPRVVSDKANSGIEMEIDDFKGKYSDPAKSNWLITITGSGSELDPFELE